MSKVSIHTSRFVVVDYCEQCHWVDSSLVLYPQYYAFGNVCCPNCGNTNLRKTPVRFTWKHTKTWFTETKEIINVEHRTLQGVGEGEKTNE